MKQGTVFNVQIWHNATDDRWCYTIDRPFLASSYPLVVNEDAGPENIGTAGWISEIMSCIQDDIFDYSRENDVSFTYGQGE